MQVSWVSRLGLGVLAVLLVAAPSRADDEKIFHFKNGRKVVAEILEETAKDYVVKTAGGRSVFAKDTVASVEDVPAPGKSFLGGPGEPERPKGKDATPAAAPATVPLASEAEIASAKRALGAVPLPNPDKPEASASRARALAAVGEGSPLGALVAIVAETATPVSPERLLALELVVTAGERARPLLARAILLADGSKALPRWVLVAIEKVGPDPAGEIEGALLAKLAELRRRKGDPETMAPILKAVGSERSLAALYDWLLAPERPDASAALAEICQAIVGHGSDPDARLRPLVRLLDPKDLPDYRKLSAALSVLGKTRGEAVPALSSILDRLETARPEAEQALALASGYRALAGAPTDAARERLLKSLRSAGSAESRLLVLGAMKTEKPAAQPSPDYLDAILASMAEPGRSPAEREAYGQALATLSGRSLGPDPAAWRAYIKSLRH